MGLFSGIASIFGGGAPKPPDYGAAAREQGQANQAVNLQQTYANRPTQITPWGQTTWDTGLATDPGSGDQVTTWTQRQTLNPQTQMALDAQKAMQARLSQLGTGMLGRVESEFGSPMQWGGLPGIERAPEASDVAREKAMSARYNMMHQQLAPQWQQREQAAAMRLRAQGLRPGDEAYDTAMSNLDQQRSNAYQQAMNNAIDQGGREMALQHGLGMQSSGFNNQLRQQAIAEQLQQRGWSLNEINAIMSGQQVQTPQMPSFQQAQRAVASPIYQAAQNQWGADIDRSNFQQAGIQGVLGGLTSLGTAGIYGGLFGG